MNYVWLALIVLSRCSGSLVSGLYARRIERSNPYIYTIFIGIAVAAFFWAYNGFRFSFDMATTRYASLFTLAYFSGTAFTVTALKYGPVSLTALMSSYSLLLPTLFGIFFYGESAGVFFYIALALLAASIFLLHINFDKKPAPVKGAGAAAAGKRDTILWLVFAGIASLGNGFCSILQTHQQRLTDGGFKAEFMITAMLAVVFAGSLIVFLGRHRGGRAPGAAAMIKKSWHYGLIAGVLNAVVNLLVMVLVSGKALSVSLIFPLISAGSLILTYAFSVTVFREKLSLYKNIGFALGIAAIVFFNL